MKVLITGFTGTTQILVTKIDFFYLSRKKKRMALTLIKNKKCSIGKHIATLKNN